MDKLSTKQAFERLINRRGIHNDLGVTSSTVRGWRKALKDGLGGITIDKMEEVLIRYGAIKLQETEWTFVH